MLHHALGEAILLGDTVKQIPLTRDMVAIVDDNDYDELSKYKWSAGVAANGFYAKRSSPAPFRKTIYMARVIMNAKPDDHVDHISGNTLDNRRQNLRICTQRENNYNRKISKNNSSGFKGVSWNNGHGAWFSQLQVNRKNLNLGYYDTPEEAARAYDRAAIKHHGAFAQINFPRSDYE